MRRVVGGGLEVGDDVERGRGILGGDGHGEVEAGLLPRGGVERHCQHRQRRWWRGSIGSTLPRERLEAKALSMHFQNLIVFFQIVVAWHRRNWRRRRRLDR